MPKLLHSLKLSPYLEVAFTVAVLAFIAFVIAGGFNGPGEDVLTAKIVTQQP